jgi:hypothetical protein
MLLLGLKLASRSFYGRLISKICETPLHEILEATLKAFAA